MDSALSRPTVARRPLLVLMLTLSILIVASLANATSAFAWPLKNCITLTPATADNQLPEDSTHTVTATVNQTRVLEGTEQDLQFPDYCNSENISTTPKAGATVYFHVTAGPNTGAGGTGVTDANGNATFSWTSSTPGTDTVEAYTAAENELDGSPSFIEGDAELGQGAVAWTSAVKNWLPPVTPPVTPQVTPSGVPATTLAVSKKCQSRKFKISASTSNGTVTKYVLQVDGRTIVTSKSTSSNKKFTINSAHYAPGSHSIKLTTYFSDGSKVVKTGKFKRCAVRTTARRISPNFTG